MGANARERVIAAASELFARQGVRASSVNAIIAESGVAKATFYRHFSSKDDVVVAWLQSRVLPRLDEVMSEVGARSEIPAERLDHFLEDLTVRLDNDDFSGFPFIDALIDLDADPSEIRTLVQRFLADTRTAMCALVPDDVPDREGTASILQLLVLGLVIRVRAEPEARMEAAEAARDAARRLTSRPDHAP